MKPRQSHKKNKGNETGQKRKRIRSTYLPFSLGFLLHLTFKFLDSIAVLLELLTLSV